MSDKEISQEEYIKVLGKYINSKDKKEVFIRSSSIAVPLDEYFRDIIKNKKYLKENEGAKEWEFYKERLIQAVGKLLNSDSFLNDKGSFLLDVLYVFFREIYAINRQSIYKERASHLKEIIDTLRSKKELGSLSIFSKYMFVDSEKLSQFRKVNSAESVIKKEVESKFKKYEDRESRLEKELNDLKDSLNYLRGDTSFLYSSKAFGGLESSAKKRVFVSFLLTCAVGVLTLGYFICMAVVLISDASFLSGYVAEDEVARVAFWEEIRLFDIKLFVISSTVVFLGVYFFRVSLGIYQGNVKKLEDYEFKAVIAFYIEGYVNFVKEAGVECDSSISKYEDFIFEKKSDDEFNVNSPTPTDTLKDLGEVAEKLIKAGRG